MQIIAEAWPEVAEPLARQPVIREHEAIVLACAGDGVLPLVRRIGRDEMKEVALPLLGGIVWARLNIGGEQANHVRGAQAALLADLARNRCGGILVRIYRATRYLYPRV